MESIIAKREPIYKMISVDIENKILSGKFGPGKRLPATALLAKNYKVAPFTIQRSLDILAKRGLINRRSKSGTFVNTGIASKAIGLVIDHDSFFEQGQRFAGAFMADLYQVAANAGWRVKVYFSSPSEPSGRLISELENDIRQGNVRTIMEIYCGNREIVKYLKEECPIFCKIMINVDYKNMTATGLKYLFDSGVKDIAVVGLCKGDNPEKHPTCKSVFAETAKMYEKQNLTMPDHATRYYGETPNDGISIVRDLCKQKKLPEALLVTSDNLCSGIIYGLLEASLKIPDDIKIITHSNKNLDICSPVTLTRLEFDPLKIAEDVFSQVQAFLKGEVTEVLPSLEPELIRGQSG